MADSHELILQAVLARETCAQILAHGLSPGNCLTIFALAMRLGLSVVAQQALTEAFSNVPIAVSNDTAGLVALPEKQMMDLLCCPAMHGANRRQAFDTLALWVAADSTTRQPGFARLLGQPYMLSTPQASRSRTQDRAITECI